MAVAHLKPTQRVRVTKTIRMREGDLEADIEGVVVSVGTRQTGSWFSHGKEGRLMLDRLRIQKDDGEHVEVILDRHAVVTILG